MTDFAGEKQPHGAGKEDADERSCRIRIKETQTVFPTPKLGKLLQQMPKTRWPEDQAPCRADGGTEETEN